MRPVRPAFEGIETRDIDDAPPAPFNHARYYRLGGEEWAIEIHGEHAAPLLHRHFCYGVDSAQSCIVDKDVYAPESGQRIIHHRIHLIFNANVGDRRNCLAAERFHLTYHRFSLVPIASRIDHNACAAPRQLEGGRPADISARAGYNCYFAF